jgi:hypothetical protein
MQGPAGSGKSTYCHAMQEHAAALTGIRQRRIHVANLDPAAEIFQYEPRFDARELISVTQVMEELSLGPNGALVCSMEYLLENLDWAPRSAPICASHQQSLSKADERICNQQTGDISLEFPSDMTTRDSPRQAWMKYVSCD